MSTAFKSSGTTRSSISILIEVERPVPPTSSRSLQCVVQVSDGQQSPKTGHSDLP